MRKIDEARGVAMREADLDRALAAAQRAFESWKKSSPMDRSAIQRKVATLSRERAKEIGVTKVELDELLGRADFITFHVPLTEKTKNIIDAAALAKMKKGVRIINCARGGLVDEAALAEALRAGTIAGAGFDVLTKEPPKEGNILLDPRRRLLTPPFNLKPGTCLVAEPSGWNEQGEPNPGRLWPKSRPSSRV